MGAAAPDRYRLMFSGAIAGAAHRGHGDRSPDRSWTPSSPRPHSHRRGPVDEGVDLRSTLSMWARCMAR
jgi:hypothetical protein